MTPSSPLIYDPLLIVNRDTNVCVYERCNYIIITITITTTIIIVVSESHEKCTGRDKNLEMYIIEWIKSC